MFRPMLAFDADIHYYADKINKGRELYGSPKLDGIRAIVKEGMLVSRTLKPIPNLHTQALFGRPEYEGLDGELIVGLAHGEGVFARTTSGVMSRHGIPGVTFWVFDDLSCCKKPFFERLQLTIARVHGLRCCHMWPVPQRIIRTFPELEEVEDKFVSQGYEGIILRSPQAPYKFGRSTRTEGYMGKLKRFKDSEGVILGFEEMMHNDNEGTKDARGFTVRSSHKANQRPAGMLGKLQVRDLHEPGWLFGVGSGFDHALRQEIWQNKEKYRGKIIKYKYLPIGTIDAPRHPIFLGFRDPADL
jgi:DNA ligase-1